jgi:coniferyl-aldehyde dehydrogenase
LPIVPYRSIDDAIAFVNARHRPLVLYVFTDDAAVADLSSRDDVRRCVYNSVAVHAAMPSLPFGGIGNSGCIITTATGFQTFSHARAIFRRGSVNAWELMRPPWAALAAIVPMIVDQE